AADYGQVGVGGVTATRRDEHRLVHVIELVLDVPGKLDVPGSSTLLGGCSGVAWEGRALARPLHRAGARRSQEARRSREFNVAGRVFRGLPGRDEHWLVRVIELVLDVPRKRDQEARRSPVVSFQSNNPKVMR